jgi:NAD(P)-dependent dehydrogenase (short-subunit alcohol dehydrogenase family)
MIARKSGRIVNLSSQAGFAALPGEAVYCMTKAGVSHLTKCLAVEWGKHGITVNAVAPTFIETPGTDRMLSDKAFRADVIERIAGLHKIGQPMDVAGAVGGSPRPLIPGACACRQPGIQPRFRLGPS